MTHDFLSSSSIGILSQSGWYSGRKVSNEKLKSLTIIEWPIANTRFQTRIFPSAFRVLREFLNIRVLQSGPGKECHTSSFEFDPHLALRHASAYNLPQNEWTIQSAIFPLGLILNSHTPFGIDFKGRILDLDEPDYVYGYDVYDAVNRWIEGLNCEQLSVKNEDSTEFGDLFALLHNGIQDIT